MLEQNEEFTINGYSFRFQWRIGVVLHPSDPIHEPAFIESLKHALALYEEFSQFCLANEEKRVYRPTLIASDGSLQQIFIDQLKHRNLRWLDLINLEKEKPILHPGYVYLMQSGSIYKIGRSREPRQRLMGLRADYPDIQVIVTVETDNMLALEKQLHELFAIQRIQGEWFELSDTDVAYIQSLSDRVRKNV